MSGRHIMFKLKKSMLLISITSASLLLASSLSFAHGKENYKGFKDEVPCPTLKDGFYVGLAAGYDSYRVVQDTTIDLTDLDPDLGVAESVSRDPRLNAT